ncbi:MAG: Lysophospholipase [Marinobacter excellens HL-55]|uniref:Lysophospholipase n=1 Tax=Marinobacter excellens HL-55 TaxID=1305731 RepID=A0A0P7YK05_9GAMM|nr:MAG: Lysophospholipase [Marinobacter excellens HL-55]
MRKQTLQLTSTDHHQITVTVFEPDLAPRCCLVISHGMAEHGDRYAGLAHWLADQGVAVVTYHHRGHGPGSAHPGHYADRQGWHRVVQDLHQVVSHTRAQFPGCPVALLGHSMGSFIAQSYIQQHGDLIDTLILSATNRIHRSQLKVSLGLVSLIRMLRGQRHPSKTISKLTFGKFNRQFQPARTTCDWLSRDPEQVDRYLTDPHCGLECSVGLWQDFIGGMLSIDPRHWRTDLPVHLFAGTDDPVGEKGKGIRKHFQAIREAGVHQVTLRLFDGGRHEMLNETNADDVWHFLLQCLPGQAMPQSQTAQAQTDTTGMVSGLFSG